MKKIPTLFERQYENHKVVGITDKVHPGMEWVLEGEGVATAKLDGACCAIFGGELYKRYDAKKGKKPPEGAIPCCEPDPVTGHWPHWVKVDESNPADKWFVEALKHYRATAFRRDYLSGVGRHLGREGTFEAIGLHFNGNPYGLNYDTLFPHNGAPFGVDRSFEGIRECLRSTQMEGIVFWKDGVPQCKIKRTDFGFEWPVKQE